MTAVSTRQFAVFRIAFGIYLTLHFIELIPYAVEMFSRSGMLGDARLNFTYGLLPNPLERWDSPGSATAFVVGLAAVALAFTLGFGRQIAALVLWFGWACLFNRNNLISNPSMPYVGMMLLCCAVVPRGEAFSVASRNEKWVFPTALTCAAWGLLALGYAFSGWTKLHSPSWIDGSALDHVLNNPLARLGPARTILLEAPGVMRVLTWLTVAVELLFLPLSLHRAGRFIAWSAMCSLHVGVLLLVNFTDLTIGMLMVHLFIFDRDWIRRLPHVMEVARSR
jgi:hypothetical protein